MKLLLLDQHAAVPFLVRSHQFLSRYAAFCEVLPTHEVEIILPAPVLSRAAICEQIGLSIPRAPLFGPARNFSILGWEITLTARFRHFARCQLERACAPDSCLVFLRTLKLAHALLPTLQKLRIPFVFESHEIFHRGAKDPEATRVLETRVYRAAALVVPISPPLRDDLQTEFGINPGPVFPSGHNGSLHDLPRYDPGAPPRFLYIGSLHSWKGLDEFLLATAEFRIPTDIVGDAGGFDRLLGLVRSRGLDHVTLHGHVPPAEVRHHYAPGSICVLPLGQRAIAQRYTSPLKVFEYAAAGRPVMIGNCPSIRSIPGIADAVHFVETSPGAWQTETRRLLDTPALRTTLATRARSVANHYTWTAVARRLLTERAIESLLRSPSP